MTRSSSEHITIVQIDGRLQAADMNEVTNEIASIDGPWALDIGNLLSADAEGVRFLQGLQFSGVQIRSASPYLKLLLGS